MTITPKTSQPPLPPFVTRHIGPRDADIDAMLATIGCASLDDLIDQTIPESIRLKQPLSLPPARSEAEALRDLRILAEHNQIFRSFIGA